MMRLIDSNYGYDDDDDQGDNDTSYPQATFVSLLGLNSLRARSQPTPMPGSIILRIQPVASFLVLGIFPRVQ
jgi:hypothetical protein